MMKSIVSIVFCCLMTTMVIAQNYTNEERSIVEDKLLFIDYTATKTNEPIDNFVRVNQQGKYNVSKLTIKANKSNVNVQQIGNENLVDVDVVAQVVEEKIVQIGDKNIFEDHNHLNKRYHGVDVYQNGNNQKILMNGNNTIVEKIKIKQVGNYKTIHINNFK
ncbi:MAG: hypothetical protein ACPGU9_04495 [Flavobacteriaceae bacterium]